MARRGEWIKLEDGTVAHVLYAPPKAKPCRYCTRRSSLLCDWVMPGGKTCDAPLCRRCAVPGGRRTDYCPTHRFVSPTPPDRPTAA
jgi:hypothetical protein